MNIEEKKKTKKKKLRTVKPRVPALYNAIRTLQAKLIRQFPAALDKLGKKGKTSKLASKLRVHYRIFHFLSQDIFSPRGKIFFSDSPLSTLTEILYVFYLQGLNTQISLALGRTPSTPSSLKWIAKAKAIRIESLGPFLFKEGNKLLLEVESHPMVPQFIEDHPPEEIEVEPDDDLPAPDKMDYGYADKAAEDEMASSSQAADEALVRDLIDEFPRALEITMRQGTELLSLIGNLLPYLTSEEYEIFLGAKSAIDYLLSKIDSYAEPGVEPSRETARAILVTVGQAKKYFDQLDATLKAEGEPSSLK